MADFVTALHKSSSRLFSQLGYENTSMKAIAGDADITPATLYYHFENKQHIVFETLRLAVAGLIEATEASVDPKADAVTRLSQFTSQHIVHQLINYESIALMYMALVYGMRRRNDILTAEQGATLRELEKKHFDMLKTILRDGAAQGAFQIVDPMLTAFAIIGMCEHVSNWVNPAGRMSPVEIGALFRRSGAVAGGRHASRLIDAADHTHMPGAPPFRSCSMNQSRCRSSTGKGAPPVIRIAS
nr:TetR/AcrR family transcriptional regulator [Sphingomonas sp. Y57]